MEVFVYFFAFIAAIGLLVAVHEFGHFWVARKMGIKVLRFSIGFGKPLWKRISGKDQTEYVVAAIPLGGYVKMLDEREGEVSPDELHRAFNRQNVWKRIAVVVAGPAFNFIFAIFAYAVVSIIGIEAFYPRLGDVKQSTPAYEAGLTKDGLIKEINGQPVRSWSEARIMFLDEYLKNGQSMAVLLENANGTVSSHVLDLSGLPPLLKQGDDFLSKTGLSVWMPRATLSINETLPGSAAKQAGLESGDKILAVQEQEVNYSRQFLDAIAINPGKELIFKVERGQQTLDIVVIPDSRIVEGKEAGFLGAKFQVKPFPEDMGRYSFVNQRGFVDSLQYGVAETWRMSIVTLKVIGRLLTGEAALKNISGPITIAEYAGKTAMMSFAVYFSFLAVISLSLGVLNLLPIPMLDGGHLMYYIIELVRGEPVSERVEAVGLRVGIVLIAGMMTLALYNDFMRLMN